MEQPLFRNFTASALSRTLCVRDCRCAEDIHGVVQSLAQLHPALSEWRVLLDDPEAVGPVATLTSIRAELTRQKRSVTTGVLVGDPVTTAVYAGNPRENCVYITRERRTVRLAHMTLSPVVARDLYAHWPTLLQTLFEPVNAYKAQLSFLDHLSYELGHMRALGMTQTRAGLLTYLRTYRPYPEEHLHRVAISRMGDGILLDGRRVLEAEGVDRAAEACCRAVKALEYAEHS